MARDFVKLSEVTVLEEVSDTASVLVEQNGEIYRAPKTQVGGAGGIKTAIIRDSGYLNAITGVSTMREPTPKITYECVNMTFEEAYETMSNGEPLMVVGMLTTAVGMLTTEGATNIQGVTAFLGTMMRVPCIMLAFMIGSKTIATLFWTADGLSTSEPSGGE